MQVARALWQLLRLCLAVSACSGQGTGHSQPVAVCFRPLAQSPAVPNTRLRELQGKNKSVSNVPF